jgi:protein SCO1/2
MAIQDSFLKKTVVVLFATLAMSAGFWLATERRAPEHGNIQLQGTVLKPPRQLAVPELTRHDGNTFTNQDLEGQWTLMFFGYTHCPDICPMTMNVLAEAKEKSGSGFPRVVFVTVDPERDEVKLLGDYVQYFDTEFVGVTGDEAMIKALTLQASVVYMKTPGASGLEADYLVDHSSSVLLINPEAQLAALLMAPHTADSINKSVEAVRAVY